MRANVIVTASGSIIGEGIIKCLKFANSRKEDTRSLSYEIVACDMNAQAPGLYRGDFGILLPSPYSTDYIEKLIKIAKSHGSQAIFCGSDEELIPLVENRERLERESGARLISNPPSVLERGMDKWKTYQFLKEANLPRAESALPEMKDEFVRSMGFPLVVKPRGGHGSTSIFIVRDFAEIEAAISSIEKSGGKPILQEFLKGDEAEFTTGIAVNDTGDRVLSSIAMRRTLKHGQTYKAFVDDFPIVRKSAEKVALSFGCIGPLNVQSRMVDGEPKVFEINPRFSASCPIRAVAGVNEPDIVFRNAVLGEDLNVSSYRKIVALRYWNELYVPLEAYEETRRSGETKSDASFLAEYF